MAKKDGGKVYVTTTHQGEIAFHEGYITNADAKRREKAAQGEDSPKVEKPELTKPAQNYVDLHRHAAIRADLIGQTGIALRLIAAHILAGSELWRVAGDPLHAAKDTIAESLESNAGHQAVNTERAAIMDLLRFEDGENALAADRSYAPRPNILRVMERLKELSEDEVLRLLTFLMIESLSVTSPLADSLGAMLGTDVPKVWKPDAAFFALIRDKRILNQMVAEYAGEAAARGNEDQPAKTQRSILNACADGTRQPAQSEWVPRYLAFPQGSYREDETQVGVVEQARAA